MLKPITKTELDDLILNHQGNKTLPIETDAVFITKEHLKDFVDDLPGKSNAVKICFVRFKSDPKEPKKIKDAGNNLTQVSLVFVPVEVKDGTRSSWSSDEVLVNGFLNTLCVCEPGIDDNNDTGLCPPNEGCPPSKKPPDDK